MKTIRTAKIYFVAPSTDLEDADMMRVVVDIHPENGMCGLIQLDGKIAKVHSLAKYSEHFTTAGWVVVDDNVFEGDDVQHAIDSEDWQNLKAELESITQRALRAERGWRIDEQRAERAERLLKAKMDAERDEEEFVEEVEDKNWEHNSRQFEEGNETSSYMIIKRNEDNYGQGNF